MSCSVPFDSVVVVENYPFRPDVGVIAPGISVGRMHADGGRTAYAVVLLATLAPRVGIRLIFNRSCTGSTASELVSTLLRELKAIVEDPETFGTDSVFMPRNATVAAELSVATDGASEALDVSAIEAQVRVLWNNALGTSRVGRDIPFFAAGGHSLSALRLVEAVRAEFGVDVPFNILFGAASTIAGLAHAIEDALIAQASDDVLADELARLGRPDRCEA
jgi:hypothetical protein